MPQCFCKGDSLVEARVSLFEEVHADGFQKKSNAKWGEPDANIHISRQLGSVNALGGYQNILGSSAYTVSDASTLACEGQVTNSV